MTVCTETTPPKKRGRKPKPEGSRWRKITIHAPHEILGALSAFVDAMQASTPGTSQADALRVLLVAGLRARGAQL